MEQFNLDFDLQGRNYVIPVTLHHEHGATFYRALVGEDHAIDYYRQENGVLKPEVVTSEDPQLVNAIATRILAHLHRPDNNSHPSVP
ncbi:hypothetical protein [Chitinophaga japonensis]|uniref:Uncharacterized protein n=1 Tax=Chitinophaga japonensis TaxID=104662 RepID=A0A562T0W6_CHIJA|nr:hypothetical protein [Chitinophaga japonensis]TWI86610.1 hypothetical protein LX66_3872 [Chitinophaga japonensis]